MLHPQRAVLIKRGNALLGRYELRAGLGCSRLDESRIACLAGPSFQEDNGSAACEAVAMKTNKQASATVMRFCLRAEVFPKAGVCVVFTVVIG